MTDDGSSRKPAFEVLFLKTIPNREKGVWMRIGEAWPTKSTEREGYHVLLDLIPNTPGRIYMFPPFPTDELPPEEPDDPAEMPPDEPL